MPVDVVCRCGRRLWIVDPTDRAVDCPDCGRFVVFARGSDGGRPVRLALAVAAAFAVLAVGLLGALIGTRRAFEERRSEPIAEAVPVPIVRQPDPDPVPQPADVVPVPPMRPAAIPDLPPEVPPAPPPHLPAPPRAGALEATIEPAGHYKVGDVIRQDVLFSRSSSYQIAGVDLAQSAEYAIQSSIEIAKVNADGSMVAVQTVDATRLIRSDAEMKAELADALDKAKGTKFELAIAPNGDVTALDGLKDPIRVKRGNDADPSRSLRLWSLLDADAWKELAGLTFFQPGQPLKPKASWSRSTQHDWGPLGKWDGKTLFVAAGKQPGRGQLERIDYRHDLAHVPPKAGADRDLPIRISKADFRIVSAAGAILYDPGTSRATMADEWFRVRGSLIVTLDGLNATIAMEEQQAFRLTIGEPKVRDLVGRPPADPRRGK